MTKNSYAWQCKFIILIMTVVLSFTASVASAQGKTIELEVNQSYCYSSPEMADIIRVSVVNPKIADVNIIDNHSLNIISLAPGSTSLTIWFNDGTMDQLSVYVASTDSNSANAIKRAINLPGVTVEKVDGKILLQGEVANQYEKDQAQSIASLFVENKDNIINLLEMSNPVQVNRQNWQYHQRLHRYYLWKLLWWTGLQGIRWQDIQQHQFQAKRPDTERKG